MAQSDSQLFVQLFFEEHVEYTVGGAIIFKNMDHAGVTIFESCTFVNNFGASGGSIQMENGGLLFILNNAFSLDTSFLKVNDELVNLITQKNLFEDDLFESKSIPIPSSDANLSISQKFTASYSGDLSFDFLISKTYLASLDAVVNTNGQIMQQSSRGDVSDFFETKIIAINMTLGAYLD